MNKITNPIKAIKAKCMDCCCGSLKEVRICPCTDCALWPFRSGKNPYRKKIELSDEQMEVRRTTMLKNRDKFSVKKVNDTAR